jgi:hypothetical protein
MTHHFNCDLGKIDPSVADAVPHFYISVISMCYVYMRLYGPAWPHNYAP